MNNKTSSISMVVLHIADNLVLKLKINLYRKLVRPNSVTMKSFYSEVEYYNQNHQDQVVNIKLDYSYGLLLESPYSEPKASVWIDWFGIYELTNVLHAVIEWFRNPKVPIYKTINGHVELTAEGNKLKAMTVINKIPLIFYPTVITDPLTNIASAGVVLTYTTDNISITIDIQSIVAWYSYISRVDLAAAAQSLLLYVTPPQPGTNRITFSSSYTQPQPTQQIKTGNGVHGIPGRCFDRKEDNELK